MAGMTEGTMQPRRILIVEDEVVVSTDLAMKLKRIGYEVAGCIRYGEQALDAAFRNHAEMVIMDIHLKGEMDGTKAAKAISENLGIPIIFLTAYSDENTINKAKEGAPYAYLKKPVRLEDLAISIDIAFYKSEMESKLKKNEIRYRTVADYTHNWETWISPSGEIEYMSPSCERVTGYSREEFLEDPSLILHIMQVDNPTLQEFKQHFSHKEKTEQIQFKIKTKTGETRWIEHVCRPVFSDMGDYIGRRGSNIDITDKKLADQAREKLIQELEEALTKVKTLNGLLPICCSCKKIRDDDGYWNQIETYMTEHSEIEFSHSICPDCAQKLYPEYYDKSEKEKS